MKYLLGAGAADPRQGAEHEAVLLGPPVGNLAGKSFLYWFSFDLLSSQSGDLSNDQSNQLKPFHRSQFLFNLTIRSLLLVLGDVGSATSQAAPSATCPRAIGTTRRRPCLTATPRTAARPTPMCRYTTTTTTATTTTKTNNNTTTNNNDNVSLSLYIYIYTHTQYI